MVGYGAGCKTSTAFWGFQDTPCQRLVRSGNGRAGSWCWGRVRRRAGGGGSPEELPSWPWAGSSGSLKRAMQTGGRLRPRGCRRAGVTVRAGTAGKGAGAGAPPFRLYLGFPVKAAGPPAGSGLGLASHALRVGSVLADRTPCRTRGAPVLAAPGVLETRGSRAWAGVRSSSDGLGRSEAR